MPLLLLLLLLLALAQSAFAAEPDQKAALVARLTANTQEMYDALVPGNKEPWKKYFSDDCMYADEKGRFFNKTQLLNDVAPMPAGYSGTIKVEKVQNRVIGDTVVLSYDLNETETIFGQELHARYHVTDTWLQRESVWQILASQAHRYYEDPAVADVRQLPNYQTSAFAGTYELVPGQAQKVTAENGKVFVERKGKKEELLPEGSDIFFRKGVEGRILFGRNNNGSVDRLIDRRNNEDVVWKRTGQ